MTFLSPNTFEDGTSGTRNIYQTILPIVVLALIVCTPLFKTTEALNRLQRNIYETDHVPAQTIHIKFALDKSLRHSTILGPPTFEDGTSGTRKHLSGRFTNSWDGMLLGEAFQ